jgi:hypothetical protein
MFRINVDSKPISTLNILEDIIKINSVIIISMTETIKKESFNPIPVSNLKIVIPKCITGKDE